MGGPRERWREAGHAWTSEVPAPTPVDYPIASTRSSDVVTQAEVLALSAGSDTVVVDVRSREEFRGERFWPSGGMQPGGRAGHIPGALWLPFGHRQAKPGGGS
jgi:thiosulfate/3-mercaptopyruvate sulfurtransferase